MTNEAPVALVLPRRRLQLGAKFRPRRVGIERQARFRRRDREHEVVPEASAEPRRHGQPPLVVQGVCELSRKLRESAHRYYTGSHFEPLYTTILQVSALCKGFVMIYL